jgi:glycosyltransferase involved in cell wall biosynthesis
MPARQTICLTSFSPIVKDARVLRHLKYLGAHYDLIAIGYGPDPSSALPGVTLRWHSLTPAWGSRWRRIFRTLARWPGRILPAFDWVPDNMMADWRAARDIVDAAEYDLFLGNDVSPLLLAVHQQKRTGKPFVMDYHEYAPLEAEEKRWHRWFHGPHQYRLLKRYGHRAAGSATVNAQFAVRFEKEFGFPAITVMNAPEEIPLPPVPPRTDDRIHLAFHGNAGGDRNLDALIRAMPLLDERFLLHLMLVSGAEPGSSFRQLAEAAPGRVIFEDPVTPSQTVSRLVPWDIGFNILQPLNYNHRHALPNKFFDYIHAGLATVCSNTVTARDFVEQHDIGWVLPEITPKSLAGLLNGLTLEDIDARKAASLRLRTRVHAAGEEEKLVALVQSVLAAA